jgi:hypothetical protein
VDTAKIHEKELTRKLLRAPALLQVVDDGFGELVGGGVASEILCLDFAGLQHVLNGTVDLLAVVEQVDVAQHFRGAEQHGSWISDVLADGLGEGVTCSLEEITRNDFRVEAKLAQYSQVRRRRARASRKHR